MFIIIFRYKLTIFFRILLYFDLEMAIQKIGKKTFILSNVKFDKSFVKFDNFDKSFVKFDKFDKTFVKYDIF